MTRTSHRFSLVQTESVRQVVDRETVSQRDCGASSSVDLAQPESVSRDLQPSETVELAEQGSSATEPEETAEVADSAGTCWGFRVHGTLCLG